MPLPAATATATATGRESARGLAGTALTTAAVIVTLRVRSLASAGIAPMAGMIRVLSRQALAIAIAAEASTVATMSRMSGMRGLPAITAIAATIALTA